MVQIILNTTKHRPTRCVKILHTSNVEFNVNGKRRFNRSAINPKKTFDLVAKLENTLSDHVIVSFFVENVAILVFVFLVLLRVPNTLKITRFELLVQFNGVSDSRYAFHLGSVWNLETLHAIAVTPSSQKKLRMLKQEYAKIDVLAYS